jgi:hypothetical protein
MENCKECEVSKNLKEFKEDTKNKIEQLFKMYGENNNAIHGLELTIKKIETIVQYISDNVATMQNKIDKITEQPTKNWNSLMLKLLGGVIMLAIGYLLRR